MRCITVWGGEPCNGHAMGQCVCRGPWVRHVPKKGGQHGAGLHVLYSVDPAGSPELCQIGVWKSWSLSSASWCAQPYPRLGDEVGLGANMLDIERSLGDFGSSL